MMFVCRPTSRLPLVRSGGKARRRHVQRGAQPDRPGRVYDDEQQRLFSNVSPPSFVHAPGSVLSASVLVAGTAVGAGILALPQALAGAGLVPAAASITGAAVFSILTGLAVAEVSINTLCELGGGSGVSLGSMATRTLGSAGSAAVQVTYLLLHYTLLVAYTAKAGSTISDMVGLDEAGQVAAFGAPAAFTLVIGGLCAIATPKQLDKANVTLVAGVIASFVFLLASVAPSVDLSNATTVVETAHWDVLTRSLPVVALSFVFQNVVPVITSQLEGDRRKIRSAIVGGISVPWAMFMLWTGTILLASSGLADMDGLAAVDGTLGADIDPLAALRSTSATNALLIDAFSLLAVSTSYIGFVLGLKEFLLEALDMTEERGRVIVYPLVLFPPLAAALAFPSLFYAALEFAGTYGVLSLFGIIPVLMTWSERYSEDEVTLTKLRLVPGGKVVLTMLGVTSVGIIADQALGL